MPLLSNRSRSLPPLHGQGPWRSFRLVSIRCRILSSITTTVRSTGQFDASAAVWTIQERLVEITR